MPKNFRLTRQALILSPQCQIMASFLFHSPGKSARKSKMHFNQFKCWQSLPQEEGAGELGMIELHKRNEKVSSSLQI